MAVATLPNIAQPFTRHTVRMLARDLAATPYRPDAAELPDGWTDLTYDQYRSLRFKPDRSLWRERGLGFRISYFPRGFLYRQGVELHEVSNGQSRPVPFAADLFESDDPSLHMPANLGFAGFRVHAPIDRAGVFSEFCVFLGASYFRARSRGLEYGLSARGLALGTGAPTPEQFPEFRTFWLERPQPGATSLIIHALLDSDATTGAFRFAIHPGETTVIDVESALFPRVDIADVGVAPLTSMFFFADAAHARPAIQKVDDWRSAVHDSDALIVANGGGERLFRPLTNPATVQFSALLDTNPHGFGLEQRKRAFDDFADLQVRYDRRPSLWVEPAGHWGPGLVALVEIPTDSEYNDNIVAFWRGRDILRAGSEHAFAYRMHWGQHPTPGSGLAAVTAVRTGAGTRPGTRVFVLDLEGPALRSISPSTRTTVEFSASAGKLGLGYSGPSAQPGSWRISLDYDPAGAPATELRCRLLGPHGPLSETWLQRWAA